MRNKPTPARIHLLPAAEAPIVAILRRKPSKRFHIIKWNTQTDAIEHGSWFVGKLYPKRCDVSFDGAFMVYLAMGADGTTWNGLCRLPWLKTVFEATNRGTWNGGGYFSDRRTLRTNSWQGEVPKRIESLRLAELGAETGEDETVLFPRLERDGWQRAGPFGVDRRLPGNTYRVAHDGDAGWLRQPTPRHPTLRIFYRGYLEYGRTYEFKLDEEPELLGKAAEWATFDAAGNLLVARNGGVERWALEDLSGGVPSFQRSFEDLSPGSHGAEAPKTD